MTQKIIHIDMDAFYASVEQRDNFKFRNRPLIVAGRPDERGVVSAASYEARRYGIRSAMPTKKALQLFPKVIIVKPDFKKYKEVSRRLYGFYKEYTDLVESLALDECYLDVTRNKKNIPTATQIGYELKKRIKKELNLTASVGIAPNKLLAKIGSDWNKPNGMFVIKPHQVDSFMEKLEVNKIWGVGKVTYKRLEEMQIKTCKDLQEMSLFELASNFGKFGEVLYNFARGIDSRPVIPEHEVKSVGTETTFPYDTDNFNFIKEVLFDHIKSVAARLKDDSIKCRTIILKVKYADFSQVTRSKTLDEFICEPDMIYKVSEELLAKTDVGKKKIRLIGISTSNFNIAKDSHGQLSLCL